MYKFLVFSDLHLTNSNSKFLLNERGVSHLLEAQASLVQWLCKKVVEDGYDGLLFLGDWTDAATLDPIVQTYSNDLIREIIDTEKFALLIEGNHCVLDQGNVFTVLGAADKLVEPHRVHVVLNQTTVCYGHVKFHCFPYISDYDELERQIAERNELVADNENSLDVMLFHFPTKNAMLDNGMPSPSGVNLGQDITSNFDLCLGGDFHRSQQIHDDAYYVGAPFDLKFGEHYRRGVTELVIGKNGYELNAIDNPFQYDIVKMDVNEFLTIDWSERADRTVAKVTGEATPDQRMEIESMKGDFYRLTAPLTRQNKEEKDVRVNVIEDNGQKDVDLIRSQMVGAKVNKKVQKRAVEIFEEVSSD